MTQSEHSYGPTCAFYDDDTSHALPHDAETPPVKAQFFYVSSLPIDDPLSPLPPVQTDKSSNQPPQPFSSRDSAALEEAWQGLQRKIRIEDVRPSSRHMFSFPKFREGLRSPSPRTPGSETGDPSELTGVQGESRKKKSPAAGRSHSSRPKVEHAPLEKSVLDVSTPENGQSSTHTAPDGVKQPEPGRRSASGVAEAEVMLSQTNDAMDGRETPIKDQELQSVVKDDAINTPASAKCRHWSPFRRPSHDHVEYDESPVPGSPIQSYVQDEHLASDMSGRPFARAPSTRNIPSARYEGFGRDGDQSRASRSRSKERKRQKRDKSTHKEAVYVPVGVSRLHLVELPELTMKPIYWSPINDTSDVVRATWFYKDTMLPVPINLANRLELGYEYIRPYADSYQDELQACISNGASAEMKVVHKLWDERKSSRPNSGLDKPVAEAELNPAIILPAQENAAAGPASDPPKRMFETHSVIYIDRVNAQILRPSLLPSVSQKRRPLSSLRKGRQIGVAVVRGFDRQEWMKLHPDPKMSEKSAHAKVGAYMSQSGDATTRGRRMSCAACDDRYSTPTVSDLVFVIHGIGQKLSERVDSYHFTHAINGLRREFNVELSSEAVKGNLKSNTGMMVLPVNWRLTVSFNDDHREDSDGKEFALENITPDTLPAIRSIISDVMLDIPYYMSHHKGKMIAAVMREANRVYRLWCRNNPGFREHGRVHLVAHSLGSVMAMEILSNQPTHVSLDADFEKTKPSEKIFEFNTTNLFCCGSPGGFFLLLNNARLIPRAGRSKPGMEADGNGPNITAESQYGCLAVDNVYNVLNRNDPISYLMNASVDADYAASLQTATVPSASLSWLSRMGTSLRWASLGPDPYTAKNIPERPTVSHMPSTVELETHNFTREEVAEKRMHLLNENGQIDYHLASGGGPLEIQYLSMLSAHSSYWLSRDFVRFLVVEVGRKPGKANTLPVLRAVKKREYKRGNLA